jgi:hypothetical protein
MGLPGMSQGIWRDLEANGKDDRVNEAYGWYVH